MDALVARAPDRATASDRVSMAAYAPTNWYNWYKLGLRDGIVVGLMAGTGIALASIWLI